MVSKKTKSSKFLRSCIFEALMLLMEQKDYDDIGISEIAAKAGVSRMTYYRTYSSKEDIFIQYFNEYIDEHFPSPEKNQNPDYRDWISAVLKAAQDHKDLILLLDKNPKLAKISLHYFIEKMVDIMQKSMPEQKLDTGIIYWIYYHAGAAAIVIRYWIAGGCKESLETMLDILASAKESHPLQPLKQKQSE